ncbi:DUF6274 family protein [Streptomyces sp. NPDC088719]|uniref:DUF6274 family protein n=1 Tax=Streptomyces sp. NPDC088719 TaxID=3365872 RepID=UPI0038054509
MSASTARHEIRALLRAHLAAASAFRHLTRHCAVCHRLLRLAMEPGGDTERGAPEGSSEARQGPSESPQGASGGRRSAGRPDGGEAGAERPSTT